MGSAAWISPTPQPPTHTVDQKPYPPDLHIEAIEYGFLVEVGNLSLLIKPLTVQSIHLYPTLPLGILPDSYLAINFTKRGEENRVEASTIAIEQNLIDKE